MRLKEKPWKHLKTWSQNLKIIDEYYVINVWKEKINGTQKIEK